MILSGKEIEKRINADIVIEPFERKRLNPNSYNLSLHDELIIYTDPLLDMKKDNPHQRIRIPDDGLVLEPNRLYLGRTAEYTETQNLVPMLEGRSSVGRLGLFVHVTAGFGDVGFKGFWTLEIFCVQPIRIYAGVEICQIYYHTLEGDYENYASGKYQGNRGIQTSQLFRDYQ
ncbi:MAG: dCTP deaminase [Desulfuromonadales bacterium]|nr:dCTP deaminase [Desulfuromonadales bacterium]MBN2792175.1 dCTP deaminase [Desulfuromonadales bacterium]